MLPAFCVPGLCLGSCFFSGPPKPVKARYDCCGLSSFGASISTNVFVASGFGIWFSVLVAVSSFTSLVSGSFFFFLFGWHLIIWHMTIHRSWIFLNWWW